MLCMLSTSVKPQQAHTRAYAAAARPFSAPRAQTSSTADWDTTLTVAALGSSSWDVTGLSVIQPNLMTTGHCDCMEAPGMHVSILSPTSQQPPNPLFRVAHDLHVSRARHACQDRHPTSSWQGMEHQQLSCDTWCGAPPAPARRPRSRRRRPRRRRCRPAARPARPTVV